MPSCPPVARTGQSRTYSKSTACRGCRTRRARSSPPSCPARAPACMSEATNSWSSSVGSHRPRRASHSVGGEHRPRRARSWAPRELADGPVEADVGQPQLGADLGQGAVPAVDALLAVGDVVVAQGGVERRQRAAPPARRSAPSSTVEHGSGWRRPGGGRRPGPPPGTGPSARRRSSWPRWWRSRRRTGRATRCSGS